MRDDRPGGPLVVGDTQQLGSPEAGGMFRLLAAEVPAAELHEVRRFHAEWDASASVRLRAGEPGVIAAYDRHGRKKGGAGLIHSDRLTRRDTVWLRTANRWR